MTSMMTKTKTPCKTLPAGIGNVLKRLHYPLDVILLGFVRMGVLQRCWGLCKSATS
ncbi:hypothetical protein QF000_008030 [Paraburkholderia atlantica]